MAKHCATKKPTHWSTRVPDTISELVAKTIADTLSCVKAKAPVKTESLTVVPARAYTVVHTQRS